MSASSPTTPSFERSISFKDGEGNPAPTLAYEDISVPRTQVSTVMRIRRQLREPAAEFLGTLLLVLFGTAANCQTTLLSNGTSAKGDWLSGCFGWGFGIAMGVWVSAGVSGGHINPAVTLTQAVFRGFSWRKVPVYWLAQLLGAFFGALITYGVYANAIDVFEGYGVRTVSKSAGLFGTFPLAYATDVTAFFTEFLATALLVMTVFAVTDKHNCPVPSGLVPLVVGFAMIGLSTVFGAQTSFAMNPARDLGPRMMSAIFYGRGVFNFRHQYWLWGPIIADFVGGMAGAFVYDLLIYTGKESPLSCSIEDDSTLPAIVEGKVKVPEIV